MRSPISWFGGKCRLVAKLLPLIPEHHLYAEPFGGGASLLFAKPPSPAEVYNDRDGDLVNFFKVLAEPRAFKKFLRRVALLPNSRSIYNEYRRTYQDQTDPVERAARWFVVARNSMSGRFGSGWGHTIGESSSGMIKQSAVWLSVLARLPQCHARLQRVQIECADWRKILDRYDTPKTFFYCDPPYPLSTRKSGGYTYELTNQDHADLVSVILRLKGKVMISGYAHPGYHRLDQAGWRRQKIKVSCAAAGRGRKSGIHGPGSATHQQPRTEVLWMNYNPGVTK